MAKSRARGLFSRLHLYSRPGNGADYRKILEIVPFGPHSAARVCPPSFGVIRVRTSRYLGTTFSDSRYAQLKHSDFICASHLYQRTQQSMGVKSIHLWTERKPELDLKMVREALWADNWSTPASVKASLKLISQGRLQSRASYGTINCSLSDLSLDGSVDGTLSASQRSIIETKVAGEDILPMVMIVGRPNVGKSALFNRLTRRREALVYNTPEGHVTRDIREGIAKLGGINFKVLDSAGLETFDDSESILGRTAGISASTLQKCHIALFLVDARAGLQPMDAEVGKWLRKIAPHVKVTVAMNKAEGIYSDPTGRLLAALGETYQLGFGDPVPISAEAGEGMGDLFDTLRPLLEEAQDAIRKLDPDGLQTKHDTFADTKLPMQLAIAGRPNVGKSTLVNALLKEERVLTGPEPGLTRDSVSVAFDYKGQKVRLVDTAGWMQRVQVKEGPAALSAMHARKGVMMSHVVALILDGEEIAKTRTSMRHTEASLARWAVQEGRGLVVVVNKMDLLAGKDKAKLRNDVMRAVPIEIQTMLPQVSGVPVVFTSALEKEGSAVFMQNVFECYEKWNARYSTAQLNRWLRKVMSRHPRSGSGYGAKVRYMTQVKARPPTFVVFVSGAGELEDTDLRFLASALREDFGLSGIPLRILQRTTRDKKKM